MSSARSAIRSTFSKSKHHTRTPPQRFCGIGTKWAGPVVRKFCIFVSGWLSQRFLNCSAWWSDVVEALNNRVPLREVRKRRGSRDDNRST